MKRRPSVNPLASLLTSVTSLGLVAGAAAPAWAATTLVVQRGTEEPATLYADGDRMRMDMPKGAGHIGDASFRPSAIIIDAVAKKIVMLDEPGKAYTEITEEDMKRVQAQLTAARAQFADKLKDLPPEQRKRLEALTDGAAMKGPPKFTFEKAGGKKTVNGMRCEMYKVLLNGVAHEEDCISPWSDGVVSQSDFAGLSKFSQTMMANMGGKSASIPLFDQYPGLPISRVPLDEKGGKGLESQVKSVKKGAVAASLFTVPAGFAKKAPPLGVARPGAGPAGGPAGGVPPASPKP